MPTLNMSGAGGSGGPLLGIAPVAIHTAANLLIWLAAVVVPTVLLVNARRESGPVRRVLTLLAAFAAATGMVQAVRDLPVWDAGSWAAAGVACGACGVWWVAVVTLVRRLPTAVADVEAAARHEEHEQLLLLEAAVAASGDGVVIADAAADETTPRIVYANPAFEQMMGYSVEEAVGLSPSVFCHPESAVHKYGDGVANPDAEAEARALESVRAALRGREPVRMELPGRRKDGSRVWAEWQVVPVAGEAAHWVAVLRDITDRRRLEAQLRESQKMDAVGRLAAGVAHDFNNLLTVIHGNAVLLSDAVHEPSAARDLLDEVRGAAERAAVLVRQLLTFGRRQPARPVVLDLNAAVADMAAILRRLLGERVTVATALSPDAVAARIDRGQFEQVLMNLAVNARDAMPRGGTVTISVAATADDRAGPGGKGRYARLAVSDTGTGMPPEVREKIFEPFFTTKDEGKGTGLGLATVYGIVTQAGGRIGVDSAVGVGTTFRVDLPRCDDPVGTTTVLPPACVVRSRTGGGLSVLLVEDEDSVRKLARIALEGCGYAVTDAADARAALDLLTPATPVDLLITDLTMPGMGGRELADHVRDVRPAVGVVFVSGYAADVNRLDAVPAAVFLPKPFTPDSLLKAAAKAVGRAAGRKAAAAV